MLFSADLDLFGVRGGNDACRGVEYVDQVSIWGEFAPDSLGGWSAWLDDALAAPDSAAVAFLRANGDYLIPS